MAKNIEYVATREGGVDRNLQDGQYFRIIGSSPPARVAWIETIKQIFSRLNVSPSPPARVAWIETLHLGNT